jgi:hypothetical protein
MSRLLYRAALFAAVLSMSVVGVASGASASSSATKRIRPHQHFVGRVNGRSKNADVTMVCALSGGSGEILQGQNIEVVRHHGGSGNAGDTGNKARSIQAVLEYTVGNLAVLVPLATFTHYGVPKAIPTLSLPCGGSGTIVFTPSGSTGTAYSVNVSFLNISTVNPELAR